MKICKGVKGHVCVVTQEPQPLNNFYHHKGYCKKCNTFLRRLRYQEDPSVILNVNKKSYEKNKDSWSDRKNSHGRKKYAENLEKERKRRSEWKRDNKDLVCAQSAKRRADKRSATPSWLTKEQEDDIKAMYTLAKRFEELCNTSYHVDHIVPLAGKDICGLHVPWNLQILPASINIAKGNKYNGKETHRSRC